MIDTYRINAETEKHIASYLEVCDPLQMMSLLMEFSRTQRHDLSDEDWRQISGCHNLLAAIFRNE